MPCLQTQNLYGRQIVDATNCEVAHFACSFYFPSDFALDMTAVFKGLSMLGVSF